MQARRYGRNHRRGIVIALLLTILCLYFGQILFRNNRSERLIAALRRGDAALALALVRAGADPNAQSFTENWSPIDQMQAIFHGQEYRRYSLSTLMLAAIGGHTDVVRELIDHGAEVNQTTMRGATALSFAIAYDRGDTAGLLRAHGARPNPPVHFEANVEIVIEMDIAR